jgi:hypothetical protein
LNSKHVFVFNIVPAHFSLEFLFIVVTESQIRLETCVFSLLRGQVEWENIIF